MSLCRLDHAGCTACALRQLQWDAERDRARLDVLAKAVATLSEALARLEQRAWAAAPASRT